MSLLHYWFRDERNRKVRGFIVVLDEGDRPTFNWRKRGNNNMSG
jgi:hypothetical protein